MGRKSRKAKRTCDGCGGKCCVYVCMELQPPKKTSDYEEMVYYVYHRDVRIVVSADEDDRTWYVEFGGRCEHLDPDGRCVIYEHRPKTCREHSMDQCEHHFPEAFTNLDTAAELIAYLKSIGKKKVARKLSERVPPHLLQPEEEPVAAK